MKADSIREPVRYSPYARPHQTQPSSQCSSSQLQLSQLHQPGPMEEQENTPPASSAPAAISLSQAPTDPYRFDFGKHKGKTVDECGQVYRDWLVKNDVPASRPALKAALAEHAASKPPPSTPVMSRAHAPLTPLSSNCQPSSSVASHSIDTPQAPIKPENFILPFGKFKGMRLGEVHESNGSYLDWIAMQACEGVMVLDPNLVKSLDLLGYTTSYNTGLVPVLPDYRSPNLDEAPAVFKESKGSKYCAWITESDVKKYFAVGSDYLSRLPRANAKAAKETDQATYYLYHVWDLVRVHGTKTLADEKRISFSRKNRSTDNFTAQDRVAKGLPARKLPTYQKSVSRGRYSGRKRW